MALISKFGVDDVYKQLKDKFRQLRAQTERLNSASAAGSVSFSTVAEYLNFITNAISVCDNRIARYGSTTLRDYARAQEEDATYEPATEYESMKSAAQTVITTLTNAVPNNSAHTVSNGTVVEPSFTTAQLATLRTQLTALIATIGAP